MVHMRLGQYGSRVSEKLRSERRVEKLVTPQVTLTHIWQDQQWFDLNWNLSPSMCSRQLFLAVTPATSISDFTFNYLLPSLPINSFPCFLSGSNALIFFFLFFFFSPFVCLLDIFTRFTHLILETTYISRVYIFFICLSPYVVCHPWRKTRTHCASLQNLQDFSTIPLPLNQMVHIKSLHPNWVSALLRPQKKKMTHKKIKRELRKETESTYSTHPLT